MNRERAETHLRQLAEAELRRATAPGARCLGHSGRLSLVAQALIAVGAVDVGTADQIQAELDLALAARQPGMGSAAPVRPLRAVTAALTASRQGPWQVVSAGQAIRICDDDIRSEIAVLADTPTAHGATVTIARCIPGVE